MEKRTVVQRFRWVAGSLAVLALVAQSAPVSSQESAPATSRTEGASVVYLVRHAERAADHPSDPTLTPQGQERAAEIARLLADVPLSRIYSTDLRRTRLTADPVARAHGLEVESYDPGGDGLRALARVLGATPGHHLVVGHSNTTPALVRALGGDPVSPIDEMEYDRIYVVATAPDGSVVSALLRFGAHGEGEG